MRQVCSYCSGKGWRVDKEDALFTLGISILFEYAIDDPNQSGIKCKICEGKGYLE